MPIDAEARRCRLAGVLTIGATVSGRLVLRRLVATAVDYACLGLGVLLAVAFAVFGVGGVAVPTPAAGQLLGLMTVTVPGVVLIAITEATGGSPGKRLAKLRVVAATSTSNGRRRLAGRTVAKYAIPWELGHAAVWRLVFEEVALGTWLLLAGAYVLPIAAGVAALAGRRPWYDLAFATHVTRTGKT